VKNNCFWCDFECVTKQLATEQCRDKIKQMCGKALHIHKVRSLQGAKNRVGCIGPLFQPHNLNQHY